jgi:uncharacterized protein YndB with AHSA1/START domain
MKSAFQVHVGVEIRSSAEAVWDALTKPELVKQYLFGTEMKADWKVGGKITYSGEWEGKPYEDHGTILEIVQFKRLVCTYWSAAFGADVPENYQTLTYSLTPQKGVILLEITQDNVANEESQAHSEQNWKAVAEKLREIVENHSSY